MKKPLRTALLSAVLLAVIAVTPNDLVANDANLIHQWNRTLIETIMEDGFGPPIAARIHAYSSVAAYQAYYRSSPKNKSLVGQLNEFKTCAEPKEGMEYDWRVAMVSAFQTSAKKLVYRVYKTDSLADEHYEMLGKEVDPEVFARSKAFGIEVGMSVLAYAKEDNYSRTQGRPDWEWPVCDSCWEPTPPNFGKPLSPYCGDVRTIVMTSIDQFPIQPNIKYSSEPGSDFWNAAIEVMETKTKETADQKAKALHWNDNPVVTNYHGHFVFNTRQISPGGHWMSIAAHLLKSEDASLLKSVETYTHTSLALFDAFIACWAEKHRSSLIRPVTYINRYIEEGWEPQLQTPPFPEHAGGHSTITAAASEALVFHFGDRPFIDSTEIEFGLPARSFTSLRDAAWEASMSRLYGGIHYRRGCDAGNAHGIVIGQYVVATVKLKDE